MPDKKPTDNEIIKALKEILEIMLTMGDLQQSATIRNALDLINRLQAENEELAYKLGCLLYHATGGKLSKHTYPLSIMESYVNDTIQDYCDEAIEETKAEAYKECIEKVKDTALEIKENAFQGCYVISKANLNKLLKELVGEDNA